MKIHKILIVEDELKVADFIQKGLTVAGYQADTAFDGLQGKTLALDNHYDCFLIDVNLPLLNGNELSMAIRQAKIETPILMLTALETTEDKLLGFKSGADDYLVKPFEFSELLARIGALLRRPLLSHENDSFLSIADLQLNNSNKTVTRGNKSINLTAKEFLLLEYLMQNQGRVVSKAEIAEKIWGIHFDTGTNVIEVYINFLRKKIDKQFPVKLLHTHVGFGYVIREEA